MPTYDYVCDGGHSFEVFEAMSAAGRRECPSCGKASRRRLGTGAGFVLKGAGFYNSDYRNGGVNGGGCKAKDKDVPASGCGAGACGSS